MILGSLTPILREKEVPEKATDTHFILSSKILLLPCYLFVHIPWFYSVLAEAPTGSTLGPQLARSSKSKWFYLPQAWQLHSGPCINLETCTHCVLFAHRLEAECLLHEIGHCKAGQLRLEWLEWMLHCATAVDQMWFPDSRGTTPWFRHPWSTYFSFSNGKLLYC